MKPFTPEVLKELFTHHPPVPGQQERYDAIREQAHEFSKLIVASTVQGPDQSVAIRKLRECVMFANAAIALEPKPHE